MESGTVNVLALFSYISIHTKYIHFPVFVLQINYEVFGLPQQTVLKQHLLAIVAQLGIEIFGPGPLYLGHDSEGSEILQW